MKSLSGTLLALCLAGAPLSAATFTVDSTGDQPDASTADNVCQTAGGACTLRAAIEQANASAGADTIAFNIPGAGLHTISPATQLPIIGGELTIDGYTQPGTSVNTDPVATNAVLLIEIEGSAAPPGTSGIKVGPGPASIRGLVVNRFQYNIALGGGAPFHEVRGCFIGTDASGTVALPGSAIPGAGTGVTFGNGTNFSIGGAAAADRNLISGNPQAGVAQGSFASGVREVIGNLVGTDATGTLAIPNGEGISFSGDAAGTITGNVASGNTGRGLLFNVNTVARGNKIGTTADGSGPLGNGADGIWTGGGGNTIGGIGPGEANVIAYNTRWGFVNGAAGNYGVANVIRGNSIHDNGQLGIDLGADEPTANDPLDADTNGSNNFQNFPILKQVEHLGPQGAGSTHIIGKLDSAATTTYDVDFYANSVCSNFPREFVEGETWLGTTQVTTDGSGHADIDVTFPVATEVGARITATATDPAGNTSEFSQRIVFSMLPASGPAAGGTALTIRGTDFANPSTVTIGGAAVSASFTDTTKLTAPSPALAPGTSNDVVVTTPDGTTGTLIKGWVSDFLDVPGSQQFYSFVTTLVSNGITAGIGAGLYGVDQGTKRQQMAVFLLKAKYGLCYTPPPCTGVFTDVPCSLIFAPWIEALAAEGITCSGRYWFRCARFIEDL